MSSGIRIDIDSNLRQVDAQLQRILEDDKRIRVTALNRAAAWARTQTVRELAPRLNVTQKPLRKRIKVFKARRNQRPPRSSLWIGLKKPIGAQEISGEIGISKTGYVKIGKRVFKNAFPARMPGGHKGIFTRLPWAKHEQRPDGQWTQLPIAEGVVNLWPDAETIGNEKIEKAYREIYPKEARRLLDVKIRQTR